MAPSVLLDPQAMCDYVAKFAETVPPTYTYGSRAANPDADWQLVVESKQQKLIF